jgi:membrane protein implicated in regulation of membrane protease activity
VISVFFTTLGGVGAISLSRGLGTVPAALVGLAAGLLLGGLVYLFARFLYSQQASSDISSADLIGRTGQVIVSIPANGLGQVRCIVGESIVEKMARSKDGSAIACNSEVMIEGLAGESAIVSPWTSIAESGGLFTSSEGRPR